MYIKVGESHEVAITLYCSFYYYKIMSRHIKYNSQDTCPFPPINLIS
jgi:hypothetical protein